LGILKSTKLKLFEMFKVGKSKVLKVDKFNSGGAKNEQRMAPP